MSPRATQYSASDFVDADDIARAKARSPHARQLCIGSMAQLMEDAGRTVTCPRCLRSFDVFDVQKNRDQVCPIVPSHLPDSEGLMKVEHERAGRGHASSTPRPY